MRFKNSFNLAVFLVLLLVIFMMVIKNYELKSVNFELTETIHNEVTQKKKLTSKAEKFTLLVAENDEQYKSYLAKDYKIDISDEDSSEHNIDFHESNGNETNYQIISSNTNLQPDGMYTSQVIYMIVDNFEGFVMGRVFVNTIITWDKNLNIKTYSLMLIE